MSVEEAQEFEKYSMKLQTKVFIMDTIHFILLVRKIFASFFFLNYFSEQTYDLYTISQTSLPFFLWIPPNMQNFLGASPPDPLLFKE